MPNCVRSRTSTKRWGLPDLRKARYSSTLTAPSSQAPTCVSAAAGAAEALGAAHPPDATPRRFFVAQN